LTSLLESAPPRARSGLERALQANERHLPHVRGPAEGSESVRQPARDETAPPTREARREAEESPGSRSETRPKPAHTAPAPVPAESVPTPTATSTASERPMRPGAQSTPASEKNRGAPAAPVAPAAPHGDTPPARRGRP
jgi:hypothetical protein